MTGLKTGIAIESGNGVWERGGGGASGSETPAVNQEGPCVFRGPEDSRRVFVVFEAAPRRPGIGGGFRGKRAKPGEDSLRKPFGGVRGGWRPLLYPLQLAQLELFFVSPGCNEGAPTGV